MNSETVPCSTHPDAPHGFDRNGSHSAGRYMCVCEGWEPPSLDDAMRNAYLRGYLEGYFADDPEACGTDAWCATRDETIDKIRKGHL